MLVFRHILYTQLSNHPTAAFYLSPDRGRCVALPIAPAHFASAAYTVYV